MAKGAHRATPFAPPKALTGSVTGLPLVQADGENEGTPSAWLLASLNARPPNRRKIGPGQHLAARPPPKLARVAGLSLDPPRGSPFVTGLALVSFSFARYVRLGSRAQGVAQVVD